MLFGLPFPTYLGWILGPVLIIGTAAYCVAAYRKFLKEENEK